ncbi:MAG: hypothetical protein QGI86_16535 [Candidatus Poribacteria bacterium]|nr:hypothetical protein [Candidatus Poribacteria bacterium]MDP6750436.1 hypothetical protein [Candidatus Poribacteria bacterium]MDP6995644.1 hypothetical protein [Candidatus Poribacteria bacterium]
MRRLRVLDLELTVVEEYIITAESTEKGTECARTGISRPNGGMINGLGGDTGRFGDIQ